MIPEEPHETEIEILFRRSSFGTDAINAAMAELDPLLVGRATRMVRLVPAIRGIEKLTYQSDDGAEYEHVDGCEGEPTCPACWAHSIRAVIATATEDQP